MLSTGQHSEMTQVYMRMCEVQLTAHCEIYLKKKKTKEKKKQKNKTQGEPYSSKYTQATLRWEMEMHGHNYKPIDASY